jgi:hypothetical protein
MSKPSKSGVIEGSKSQATEWTKECSKDEQMSLNCVIVLRHTDIHLHHTYLPLCYLEMLEMLESDEVMEGSGGGRGSQESQLRRTCERSRASK